jgi:hypothetical protein
MKRMIVMMLLIASTAVNVVLATGDDNISWKAKKTFERKFPGALFAQWSELKETEMYAVRFVYNDQALLAYIDPEGAMIATVRNSDKIYLPFAVNESIKEKYKGFDISKSVEELITTSDVSYVCWVENDKKRILIRVYSNGTSYEIKKEKRKAATRG